MWIDSIVAILKLNAIPIKICKVHLEDCLNTPILVNSQNGIITISTIKQTGH
jgi:hypothetical protein